MYEHQKAHKAAAAERRQSVADDYLANPSLTIAQLGKRHGLSYTRARQMLVLAGVDRRPRRGGGRPRKQPAEAAAAA